MEAFVYNGLPARVIFGSGTLGRLGAELERLDCRHAFLLATPQQEGSVRALAETLGGRAAGVFAGAAMHTPIEVTEAALAAFEQAGADCTVALGGGSTTGLGKALALRTDRPQVVIPTTYAGSEMTPILGQTEGGKKTTLRSPKVLPEVVLYDVDLTLTLPPALSATSGMNAIAHAVEGLYTQDANPIVSLMAEEGIRALASALPRIHRDPADRDARSDALYGAWLCGVVLGSVGMALHHKLCHTLGGMFDLPHAQTHTALLPHALAYNRAAAPAAMEAISRALQVQEPAAALYDLARSLGATMALRELGMPHSGIAEATERSLANPYWNPQPLERAGILALLTAAYEGERPV